MDYFVAEGKTQTEAARLEGYSFPEYEGYRLVRQPRMIQVIQAARQKYYQTNLANVAVSTLHQVMQDPNAPAAARVSAARILLALDRYEEALKMVDTYSSSGTNGYIHELTGDILVKQNKNNLAIAQYELAAAKYSDETSKSIISMKIANTGT